MRNRVTPTESDGLYAGNRHKARILARTESGVDVDGAAFAPYTGGPFIWYPAGRASKVAANRRSADNSLASARRLAKRIGVSADRVTRGGGIKFDSYAEFKQSLGRSNVDLRGASAPHMLQAIEVKTTGNRGKLRDVVIGVYGEAAARAQGHNEGTEHLPKRRWFGASKQDAEQFSKDIIASIKARLGE